MLYTKSKLNCRLPVTVVLAAACLAGMPSRAAQSSSAVRPLDGATEQARVKIGPGDLIEVQVFDEPNLQQTVRLNDLGGGSLNFIGSLHLAGLTTDEAGALIAGKLKEGNLLLAPQVTVIIREYSRQGVSVVGEVKTPGVYSVIGGQSLLDVLAAAGGTTPFAGPQITIQRAEDRSTLTITLTKDPHQSLSSDVRLYPGDKVVIPRAGLVYVLGDVGRAGGFVMENDGKITLLQALALAGGTTRTSSMSGARLLRKGPSGYEDIHIELGKMLKGRKTDVQLQTEDILYVPGNTVKSAFARTSPAVLAAASGATSAAIYGAI